MEDLGQKWKEYKEWSHEDMRTGNVPFDGSPGDKAIMVYGFLNWIQAGCPDLNK